MWGVGCGWVRFGGVGTVGCGVWLGGVWEKVRREKGVGCRAWGVGSGALSVGCGAWVWGVAICCAVCGVWCLGSGVWGVMWGVGVCNVGCVGEGAMGGLL